MAAETLFLRMKRAHYAGRFAGDSFAARWYLRWCWVPSKMLSQTQGEACTIGLATMAF